MKDTDEEGYVSYTKSTISGTTKIDGKDYFVITEDYDDTNLRIANNIVYFYLEDMYFGKALAKKAAFETGDVPMYDFNKSSGGT